MRTLKFIIDGLTLSKDPNCDFEGLIPGTSGYVNAEFEFSPEWDGCNKVIEFRYREKEFPPRILADGKTCDIPEEALNSRAFYVKVLGKGDENKRLLTNSVAVVQNGGTR